MVGHNTSNCTFSAIGAMSGTSLDGLDLAFCTFHRKMNGWTFGIECAETIPFPKDLNSELGRCSEMKETELKNLDHFLGKFIGLAVKGFIEKHQVQPEFVASHGHTVFHQPEQGKTLQIGNGQEIANHSGLLVINDFRTQDVLLGGQGAPLVPIGDQLLFPEYKYCLNLGGIANVSIKSKNQIGAYDICICNVGLNHFARTVDLDYDKDGKMGREGRVDQNLLDQLNTLEYYNQKAPKSLDASYFKKTIVPIIQKSISPQEDKLRTLYEHISYQITGNIQGLSEILVTGGGAHNSFLVELLREKRLNIVLPKNEVIDYKEALIFAVMGGLFRLGEMNVLSSVTGARMDHVSGKSFSPKNETEFHS